MTYIFFSFSIYAQASLSDNGSKQIKKRTKNAVGHADNRHDDDRRDDDHDRVVYQLSSRRPDDLFQFHLNALKK